ncbi:MAG: helix-turn-helix domain-containing protein [Phycisphaerales bacterium]
MHIAEHTPGDTDRLSERIASEKQADRRDRYRIALLALRGREKLEIAEVLGIAKSTVEQWAYAYRDGGIAALAGKKRGGSRPKIDGELAERLRARVEAGPTAQDKVCTLHRLRYSCLAPRPRHEKQDLAAQTKFKDQTAPLL